MLSTMSSVSKLQSRVEMARLRAVYAHSQHDEVRLEVAPRRAVALGEPRLDDLRDGLAEED